jgi:asparagine synthase (glutamine-hydrolysing)
MQEQLLGMMRQIKHRGPDSGGSWLDAEAGIALGHRRLAIVDVSPAGAQPMLSVSGRWLLAFNGEIYNHKQLRAEMEKVSSDPVWRGHSDTETLLAGFDVWGIESTVKKCIGMFAFAVWDKQTRCLTLGRDRLGEKPLYYGWQGQRSDAVFLFGSELKALRSHPSFFADICPQSLGSFLQNMAVGGAQTIYQGICKVCPGRLVTITRQCPDPVVRGYWSLQDVAVQGVAKPFNGSVIQAVDSLEKLLKNATNYITKNELIHIGTLGVEQ